MGKFLKQIFSALYIGFIKFFYYNNRKVLPDGERFLISKKSLARKKDFLIAVNNQELGKRIHKILEAFIGERVEIDTFRGFSIVITLKKFFSDKNNSVKWYRVEFENLITWDQMSCTQKKNLVCGFVIIMQKHGFVLDSSRIDFEVCTGITDVLSKFRPIERKEDIKENSALLLKILNFIYSGYKNFDDEYFKNILENYPTVIERYNMPYEPVIFTACLNYYLNSEVPEIERWNYQIDEFAINFYVFYNQESGALETEKYKIYTVFDTQFKVYKNPEALKDYFDVLYKLNMRGLCVENMGSFVYDLRLQKIGYQVEYKCLSPKAIKIQEISPLNANDILNYFRNIFFTVNEASNTISNSSKIAFSQWNVNEEFLINNQKCYFVSLDSLYEFINSVNFDVIYEQIENTFWKMYLGFLKEKYPDIKTEDEIYLIPEVRFLNPYMAKCVSDKFFGKDVGYTFVKKLKKFLLEVFVYHVKAEYFFDPCFIYSPEIVPFVFENELEQKYGVKYVADNNIETVLSDGRRLKLFEKATTTKAFDRDQSRIQKTIRDKLGDEFKRTSIVSFSELIYSEELNSSGMYKLIGYITTPYSGDELSYEFLCTLDNRELFNYVGSFFARFSKYDISFEFVKIDKNSGTFYINAMDPKFEIRSTGFSTTEGYLKNLFEELVKRGYNRNAFFNLKPESWSSSYFLKAAESYVRYCNEHKIYYSGIVCPVCAETKYYLDSYLTAFPVYSTSTSKHYKIDDDYFVKIYTRNVDMDLAEKMVDKAIERRVVVCDAQFGYNQDCFIPIKKVYTRMTRFVGYLYKKVNFTSKQEADYCINLKEDFDMLTNLPRLKALIRLIMQVKNLTSRNLGFVCNPFGHVFLSKTHRKQVQILDIEFLCEGIPKDQTMKWTYEYVLDTIGRDKTLEINHVEFDPNLDNLLEELQKKAKALTKFCSTHNSYYDGKYICCPQCVSPEEQINIPFEYVPFSEVRNWKKINEGGESSIYHYEKSSVAKVFKDEQDSNVNPDFKNKIIIKFLNRNALLDEIDLEYNQFKFALPRKLLIDPKTEKIYGYIMEKVDGQPISDLRDKSIIKKLGFTKREVLQILIEVSKGIEILHDRANVYIGDLNGRNILFDKERNVYFLDFDGMGIDDIKPEFCTDGYIDPVSKKNGNITMADDWYSFAIQAFYYLTYTHPFNGTFIDDQEKTKLSITDKMEKRISLLGMHGIKAPSIAEEWSWMIPELKEAFLEIFERGKRYSITELLERQYEILYGGKFTKDYSRFTRISKKMIGACKMLQIDNSDLRFYKAISKQLGIYQNSSDEFVAIVFDKNTEVARYLYTGDGIQKLIILDNFQVFDNLKYASYVLNGQINLMNLTNPNVVETIATKVQSHLVKVKGNKLYYVTEYHNRNVIAVVTIDEENGVATELFEICSEYLVLDFDVQDDNKFMIVYYSSNTREIIIYGNNSKIASYEAESKIHDARIFYDEATKTWAIVENAGKACIVKKSNGVSDFHYFQNRYVLKNMSFVNGRFYYTELMNQNVLCMENINSKENPKRIELKGISYGDLVSIYNVTAKGFDLMSENGVFEVRIG